MPESNKSKVQVQYLDGILEVKGIPENYKLEQVARSEGGKYFVVYRPKKFVTWRDYQLYIGGSDALEETNIRKYGTQVGWGKTTIHYESDGKEGSVIFPALKSGQPPKHIYADKEEVLEDILRNCRNRKELIR